MAGEWKATLDAGIGLKSSLLFIAQIGRLQSPPLRSYIMHVLEGKLLKDQTDTCEYLRLNEVVMSLYLELTPLFYTSNDILHKYNMYLNL